MNMRHVRVHEIGTGIIAAKGSGPNEGKVFVLFDGDSVQEERAGWFATDARTLMYLH